MSARIDAIAQPKLRYAWFWWAVGWLLLLLTINQSLKARVELMDYFPSDKTLHFAGYFGLAFWFAGITERRRYFVLGLLLVAFGGALEIAQTLMRQGRTGDWVDFLANSFGIIAALSVAALGLGMWMVWIERLFGLQK